LLRLCPPSLHLLLFRQLSAVLVQLFSYTSEALHCAAAVVAYAYKGCRRVKQAWWPLWLLQVGISSDRVCASWRIFGDSLAAKTFIASDVTCNGISCRRIMTATIDKSSNSAGSLLVYSTLVHSWDPCQCSGHCISTRIALRRCAQAKHIPRVMLVASVQLLGQRPTKERQRTDTRM